MKRDLSLAIVVMVIVAFCCSMTPARAAEQAITFKPTSVTIAKDRNGAEYVRMIWGESKEINGIKYSGGATVNAYRENLEAAKKIKAGDTVTAVVSKKEYNGTTYYTVLAFVPTAPAKK